METSQIIFSFTIAILAVVALTLFERLKHSKALLNKAERRNDQLGSQLNDLQSQNERNQTIIQKQLQQIAELNQKLDKLQSTITDQGNKLKEYENFIKSLKEAQEKIRNGKSSSKPNDDIHVKAKPTADAPNSSIKNDSDSTLKLIRNGFSIVRMALLLLGIPMF